MASTAETSDEDVPVPVKRRIDGLLEPPEPVELPELPEPEDDPEVPELPDPLEPLDVPELPEVVELPDVPELPDPVEELEVPELPDPAELLDELPDPVEPEEVPESPEVAGGPGAAVAVIFGPTVEPGVPQAVRTAEIAAVKAMMIIRGSLAAAGVTTGGTIPPFRALFFGLPTDPEPAKNYLGVPLTLSNGLTWLDVVRF